MAIIEKVTCFPNKGTPDVIPGDPVAGDLVRITNGGSVVYQHYTPPQSPPAPKPIVMSDKQFRKFAAQQLGSSADVGAIWKAANDSTDSDVKFALMAWSKADTFEKSEVAALTTLLVAGGCMTANQRTDILGNWPVA